MDRSVWIGSGAPYSVGEIVSRSEARLSLQTRALFLAKRPDLARMTPVIGITTRFCEIKSFVSFRALVLLFLRSCFNWARCVCSVCWKVSIRYSA